MSKHEESRGFLNRWSARKQAVEKDRQAGSDTDPAAEAALPSERGTASEAERLASLDSAAGDTLTGTTGEALLSDAGRAANFPSTVPPLPASGSASQQVAIDEAGSTGEPAAGVAGTEQTAKPLLVDADMPPIESLTASSDISGFLSKGVSAALRKAALRHVFRQSSYNVRDGLNDYDGDFTVFEPLGDTVTSDMKFHAARKEKARLEAEMAASEEQARLEAEQNALVEEDPLEAEREAPTEDDRLKTENEASADEDRLKAENEASADEDGLAGEREAQEEQSRLDAEDKVREADGQSGGDSEAPAESDRLQAEQLAAEQTDGDAETRTTADHEPTVSADEDPRTRNQDSTAG